jgi:formamidopyrimidine-DNA glycosylase
MPELPEVETVRRGLEHLLPGNEITSVEYDWPKSFPNAEADVERFVIGAMVIKVARRAKVLLIELSSKYSLIVHLKMTGQLVFRGSGRRFGAGHPSASLVGDLPDKSTRVIITFKDGSKMFFNDQRKFGWVRLMPTAEIVNLDFIRTVGPEPLADDFNWQSLRMQLARRPGTSIKAALLDQKVIAGIGNIYADESLWGARIHPATPVKQLSAVKIRVLYEEIVFVLELAIEKGGSTDKNYVDAQGRSGSYLSFARVFRRQGQPCSRCGTEIVKIRVAGRGTHLCPRCQKLKIKPVS